VALEDVPVADGIHTTAGQQPLVGEKIRIGDGRLTVDVGDGAADTALAYVAATEAAVQPFFARYVNFQPVASPVPLGFVADTGAPFGASGFGWDANVPTRDRNLLDDPVRDTFVFAGDPARTWRLVLPPDLYRIELTIGDAQLAKPHQRVVVEGTTWVEDVATAAGEFLTLRRTLEVSDGELAVTIGSPEGNTSLVYAAVESLPRDVDGDGAGNLADNCLEDANASQSDVDHDGVGDACNDHLDADGDDWADTRDNCPSVANPLQTDGDGDRTGNACDCAPANGGAEAIPQSVTGLRLAGGATTTLTWDSQSATAGSGTQHAVVRGTLSGGAPPYTALACVAPAAAGTTTQHSGTPAPGTTWFYLVRAHNACGSGGYGEPGAEPGAREAIEAADPCF
jgi:hypothetical protein